MKKVIVISACIVIVCLLSIFVLRKPKTEETKAIEKIKITNFSVKDRIVIHKNNSIYVGNNIKELENDFYDVKIMNNENDVEVYLNKLWYKTYGSDYIQDEYLAAICRQLAANINIASSKDNLEYFIYKYIKDNYTKVRDGEKIEVLGVESLELALEYYKGMAKLTIRGV